MFSDATFVEGVAVVIASVLVFCGSVWLLLTMVLGGRLAYFITATVTLGFVLILGLVWSFTSAASPLGPLGKLPEWDPLAIGEEGAQLEAPQIDSYPESPWTPFDVEDEVEAARASDLESSAGSYVEDAVAAGDLPEAAESSTTADSDATRLLEEGGTEYGAVTLAPPEGEEGPTLVAVLTYDTGDPLGPARLTTAGTFILFVAHLGGLAWSERRAAESRKRTEGAPSHA